jgi:uncharacterized protein YoxC
MLQLAKENDMTNEMLVKNFKSIIKSCLQDLDHEIQMSLQSAEEHQKLIEQENHELKQINEELKQTVEAKNKIVQRQHTQIDKTLEQSAHLLHANNTLMQQLEQANLRIQELEAENKDLRRQISENQQHHAHLVSDVLKKTHVSRDGPAEENTRRVLDPTVKRIKHVAAGPAASGPAAGTPHALGRAKSLQPAGRGSQIFQPQRWRG